MDDVVDGIREEKDVMWLKQMVFALGKTGSLTLLSNAITTDRNDKIARTRPLALVSDASIFGASIPPACTGSLVCSLTFLAKGRSQLGEQQETS